MIDLLNSALFSIEDATDHFDDNLNVLKNAHANGINACVLTPNCALHRQGDTKRFLEKRNAYAQKLKQLNLVDVPQILYGAKVLLDHDLSLHKDIDKLCLGCSKFMLVELPNFNRIPDFDEWIYNLNMIGITPIIAHVERHFLWKGLIEELSSVKVGYQVGASTLNNLFKRKVIKKLISARKKFFVSSDTHDSASQPIVLQVALKKAKKYFPKHYFSFFLTDFNFYI